MCHGRPAALGLVSEHILFLTTECIIAFVLSFQHHMQASLSPKALPILSTTWQATITAAGKMRLMVSPVPGS